MKSDEAMASAFKSQLGCMLFFISLLILVLLPSMRNPDWADRLDLYRTCKIKHDRRVSLVANRILESNEDIDILFIGPSTLRSAINPLILNKHLTSVLGREPVIYSHFHPGGGFDYDYIALKDILNKRQIKLIFWLVTINGPQADSPPHWFANYLWDFRMHNKDLHKLHVLEKIRIYWYSILNQLRLSLNCLRSKSQLSYLGAQDQENFNIPITENNRKKPEELTRLIHARGTDSQSYAEGDNFTPRDQIYFDAICSLIQSHKSKLVITHFPFIDDAVLQNPEQIKTLVIPKLNKQHPAYEAPIMGITFADLFPNQSIEEISRNYFSDNTHYKLNMTNYITYTFLPAIEYLFLQSNTGSDISAPLQGSHSE